MPHALLVNVQVLRSRPLGTFARRGEWLLVEWKWSWCYEAMVFDWGLPPLWGGPLGY